MIHGVPTKMCTTLTLGKINVQKQSPQIFKFDEGSNDSEFGIIIIFIFGWHDDMYSCQKCYANDM